MQSLNEHYEHLALLLTHCLTIMLAIIPIINYKSMIMTMKRTDNDGINIPPRNPVLNVSIWDMCE